MDTPPKQLLLNRCAELRERSQRVKQKAIEARRNARDVRKGASDVVKRSIAASEEAERHRG